MRVLLNSNNKLSHQGMATETFLANEREREGERDAQRYLCGSSVFGVCQFAISYNYSKVHRWLNGGIRFTMHSITVR